MPVKQMSVQELNEKLGRKGNFKLIDVREPNEFEICRIEGSTLIPLSQFMSRASKELKREEEILIHCHHGGRSQRACDYLVSMGYENVSNVAGGIDAWSMEIEPEVPRY